jgi:hypothetical protein
MKYVWATIVALWLATILNVLMIERRLNALDARLENIEYAKE